MKRYAKTPTVLQMEATECGAASLAMILAYYGRHVPLEQMRIETNVSRDGVTASSLVRAAVRFGLQAKGWRKKPESLKTLTMPCILHWEFNHFVVLEGFKGKHVLINDPAYGRRKLTYDEFINGYSGIVLTFSKTNEFKKNKKPSTLPGFIAKRLKGQWKYLFMLVYIGLLLVVPGLILPVLSRVFVDDILAAGYTDWLIRLLLFIGGCLLVKGGLEYYRAMLLTRLRSKMTLVSGYQLLDHMFSLPIPFFSQRSSGDLVNRMYNNESVNSFLAGDLAEAALSIFTALFYLAMLLFYNPILTAIGLGGMCISLLVSILATRALASTTLKQQMKYGKLFAKLASGMSILDSLQASGTETDYCNHVIGAQADFANEQQKLHRFQQMISAVPSVVSNLSDVLILVVGAMMIISGNFTAGMLIGFNALFDSFAAPINQLIGFFEKIQTMKSDLLRVNDIQRYPAETKDADAVISTMKGRQLAGFIEVRNVIFGYAKHLPPTVSGIDFKVNKGQILALIGPSGCGKTTVAKIVSGLYKPDSGQVLFDGTPISKIPDSVLHASLSMVSQDDVLFSGTIRDNLTLWSRNVADEDVIRAAKDACIHDFIMTLPGQYNYHVTENADNLSGGQKQRLQIARALVSNPSILILDEATKALDTITEKQLLTNLRMRGCTCVMVAHRKSAYRNADQILVIDHGHIVNSLAPIRSY